jgi:hypothetical protein
MQLTTQGSWSGKGLKQRKPNQRFLKKTAGIDMTQRKDFKRNNVIITEKIDKKAAQFLPVDLPYPYTSKAQYEASFKMPVGAEWNSRTTHQKETMPRVVKKVSLLGGDADVTLTNIAWSHHRTHRETVLEFGSRSLHALALSHFLKTKIPTGQPFAPRFRSSLGLYERWCGLHA